MASDKILPITGLKVGGVTPSVLVCGDPGRADKIAARLDGVELLCAHREYHAWRGVFRDLPVTICSHGIGAPGAAIAFEELIEAGGRRLVRVGTCGSLQPDIDAGHLVVPTAAVQGTGYGRAATPPGYPAVADLELCLALRQAAGASDHPFRSGLILSSDVFYEGIPGPNTPNYPALSAANVLAVEMECEALFLVGSLRGVRTAAILAVDGQVLEHGESMDTYRPHREIVAAAIEAEIEIALEALQASVIDV